jgi:hypothetical protein
VASGSKTETTEADEATAQYLRPGSKIMRIITKQKLLSHRQLFNTAGKRLGFTTKGVLPGDLICVFHGATTCHVLREAEYRDGQQVYRAIGDAFVHGLMHGKLDLESDDLAAQEQDLVII